MTVTIKIQKSTADLRKEIWVKNDMYPYPAYLTLLEILGLPV